MGHLLRVEVFYPNEESDELIPRMPRDFYELHFIVGQMMYHYAQLGVPNRFIREILITTERSLANNDCVRLSSSLEVATKNHKRPHGLDNNDELPPPIESSTQRECEICRKDIASHNFYRHLCVAHPAKAYEVITNEILERMRSFH